MRSMRRGRRQGGFTLIEVMIALAILAIGLVALMRSSATNIYMAQRAQMLTAATNLARGKMYDLEERLLTDGYQELDIVEEGNFAEEGWPAITWKAEIVKIELPDMATLQGLGAEGGEAGGVPGAVTGDAGPAAPTGTDPAAGEGGGMLEMFGLSGDMSEGGAGAGMMGTYYSLVSDVLKEAIRKVTLTVSYPIVGGELESFVVTCYFTDPAAVNRKVPQAAGQEEEEEDGQEGPGTGQEGTGGQGRGTGQEGTGGRGTGAGGTGGQGTGGQGTGGRGTGGTGPGRGGSTQ